MITVQCMRKCSGNSMFFRLHFLGDGTMINIIKARGGGVLQKSRTSCFTEKKTGGRTMLACLDYLRELNAASMFVRLLMAMLFGGLVGLDRQRKHRPAGFRTHMLVCMGAALTMLLSQYEYEMMQTAWAVQTAAIGGKLDVARFGAQVINGIGFLGAGTIIVTSRQKVQGLTTAAGLWASACMGLAIGAGFYECVVLVFVIILLVFRTLPFVENMLMEKARNMNIYVEFQSMLDVSPLIGRIKSCDVHIYEVEIQRDGVEKGANPSAVFTIRLNKSMSHAQVLAIISDSPNIYTVEEI